MKKVFINTPIAKLMKEPTYDSELSDEMLQGMEVTILDELSNAWLKVKTEYNYDGFLHSNLLSFREYNDRKIIVNSFVDVLANPKVQSEIIETLPMGSFVKIVSDKEENSYIKIELVDGRHGYAKKAFINKYSKTTKFSNQDEIRDSIIDTAFKYLGSQYRWGGKTHLGIDCSGLCFMSYFLNGITIYRDAKIVEGFPVKPISRENMKKADLLYFPGHIAMFLGNDLFIHSSFSENGVGINSLNSNDSNYRKDLAESILSIGSIF